MGLEHSSKEATFIERLKRRVQAELDFIPSLFSSWIGLCMVGLLLLAYAATSSGGEGVCKRTPYIDDGSVYPKSPLTYAHLEEMISRGGGQKSRNLYEIYGLQELSTPSILRKTVVNWQKTANGTYFNDVAGWYPEYNVCYGNPLFFTRADGGSKYVKVKFNIFLPTPREYVGTLYSSCPDIYIISWFCPVDALQGKKCTDGARVSVLTFEDTLDHIPWHEISGDICRNKSPPLDDPRWTFTHTGETQCQLPGDGGRRKRDAAKYSSHEEIGRHLWP